MKTYYFDRTVKHNLLIIDDDICIIELLKRLINPEIFNISFTTSPHAALTKMKFQYFDLVITDYQMPKMDGVNFILKAINKYCSATKFILMSGYSIDEINAKTNVNLYGFIDGFLQKPFSKQDLYNLIDFLITPAPRTFNDENLKKIA